MSEVADFTNTDENTLLGLDRAHKAYEQLGVELHEALRKAEDEVYARFNPIIFEAKSVLYEAMGKAAAQGFTYAEMIETMGCAAH